jgi:hypothetical protein
MGFDGKEWHATWRQTRDDECSRYRVAVVGIERNIWTLLLSEDTFCGF